MKKSRIAAWALAAVMAVSTATAYVPANAAVKVKKVTVASSLSGNKKTVVVAKGKSVKLATTVTVKPNKKANKKVSYSVKDKKIATVSNKGVIKGKKVGTTKVTVTSAKNKKKKATINVKVVKAAVTKVTVNKKKASLNVGQTLKLKTTVKAGKGANKTIAYTTSKKKVATVSKKGVITAVGTGSATITAKAIDGSGKKATCKVTVANPINLASMEVLNERSVSFALDKPLALNADQVSIKNKKYVSGTYNNVLKINNMTTNDNVNYTAVFDNDSEIVLGDFVQVSVPSLTGTVKSLEMQYKDQICAFTGEEVSAWTVGKYGSDSFYFGQRGYSAYTITAVPTGLTAEVKDHSVVVKGVPTTVGVLDATLTAVDELGNTLTRTIHFIVGDDNTVVGAGCQEYCLYGSTEVKDSLGVVGFFTGGGAKAYYVVSDPYNIVTNKSTTDGLLDSDWIETKFIAAGTYPVTVRAVSIKDPSKFADINVVFNVKQGVVIGGALKDAQGYPMPVGKITYTNKDRASHYLRAKTVKVDPTKSTFSAVLDPGTYDIEASYSAEDEDAEDYTLSRKYLYSQSLTETRTGYDIQLEDIYKVVISVPENCSYDWYYNKVSVSPEKYYIDENNIYHSIESLRSTVYLKNGTYTLESDEWPETTDGSTTGDWFNGSTTTTTSTKYKYTTAAFTVNGAGVVVPVATVASGQPTTENYTRPAAKNTTAVAKADGNRYSLGDVYEYYAYSFTPDATGTYEIDSYSDVCFYNMDGTKVDKNADGYYDLTADTKYIVANGGSSYGSFTITKKVKAPTEEDTNTTE